MQGLRQASVLVGSGIPSVLRAMQAYQRHAGLLKSWRDVFVDLVQGQVQHLLLSMLTGKHLCLTLHSERWEGRLT